MKCFTISELFNGTYGLDMYVSMSFVSPGLSLDKVTVTAAEARKNLN